MLEGLELPKRTFSCKVREIAAQLDKKDSEIFLAAVNNPEWPVVTLVDTLRARGIDISPTPVTKHRRKACSC